MSRSRLENVQVLIVDDERWIQRLVSDVLTQLGFKFITTANNGRKAIELISSRSFDFIITDWRMPDMEGIDLVRYVRTSLDSPYPRIPIIMLTGNTEARNVIQARDAGVNEYVIKPFSAEQLTTRIRAIVEKPRSFVNAPSYKGPDRRWHELPSPAGAERRKAKNKK